MVSYPPPLCFYCRNQYVPDDDDPVSRCRAYPDGIPVEILRSSVDHREPYPGDQGIVYNPDPGAPNTAYWDDMFDPSRLRA